MNLLIVCDAEEKVGDLHNDLANYFWDVGIKKLSDEHSRSIVLLDPCEKIGTLNVERLMISYGDIIRVIHESKWENYPHWYAVSGDVIENAINSYYDEEG